MFLLMRVLLILVVVSVVLVTRSCALRKGSCSGSGTRHVRSVTLSGEFELIGKRIEVGLDGEKQAKVAVYRHRKAKSLRAPPPSRQADGVLPRVAPNIDPRRGSRGRRNAIVLGSEFAPRSGQVDPPSHKRRAQRDVSHLELVESPVRLPAIDQKPEEKAEQDLFQLYQSLKRIKILRKQIEVEKSPRSTSSSSADD